MEIVETSGHTESAYVLHHLLSRLRPGMFAWDLTPSCRAPQPGEERPKGALGHPSPWPPSLGCIKLSGR